MLFHSRIKDRAVNQWNKTPALYSISKDFKLTYNQPLGIPIKKQPQLLIRQLLWLFFDFGHKTISAFKAIFSISK